MKAYLILPNRCFGGEVDLADNTQMTSNLTTVAPDANLICPVWNDIGWVEQDTKQFELSHPQIVQASPETQMIDFLGTQVGALTQRVAKLEAKSNG